MRFLPIILTALCALAGVSCTTPSGKSAYSGFASRKDYPRTMEVFRDYRLLSKATPETSKIKVDLSDQRTQLLVGDQVALDAPCCTGRPGKATPTGTFPIKEKIQDKQSNIFGSIYRGGVKVHGGDRRSYGGSFDKFVGASLPYWMRLTDDGIGIHGSKSIHRSPRSNGCIRMPEEPLKVIYSKVSPGTKVLVSR